jgi:hypothetical protein
MLNLKPNNDNLLMHTATSGVSNKTLHSIVKAVLTNQLALFYNEKIKTTIYYKQELKQALNKVIKILVKVEAKEFDDFSNTLEEQVDFLQDMQFDMIEKMGLLEPADFPMMAEIVEAYVKKPKSMLGLARKINREK